MALSFLSIPDIIRPVYGEQKFTIYDTIRNNSGGLYYELDVSIASQIRTVRQLPDINKEAIIDIQKILQGFFDSSILSHSSLKETYTSGLIQYDVIGRSIVNDVSVQSGSYGYYSFNGVEQGGTTFDSSVYLFPIGQDDGKFLSNWSGSREIGITDDAFIQFFDGTLDAETTGVDDITVKDYKFDGTTDTTDIDLTLGAAGKIVSVNVGPVVLNANGASIDSSTDYYTIEDQAGKSEVLRFNIKSEDRRFTKYQILYVGGLGSTEFFNFTLNDVNTINISKIVYKNDNIRRSFNTNVLDNYKVYSDWMTEETSSSLKELWYSPATAHLVDYVAKPTILSDTSKTILNRRNKKILNYDINFSYSNDFVVPRH